MCDRIFNNYALLQIFPENLPVKEFENWLRFDRIMTMSYVDSFFWLTLYDIPTIRVDFLGNV